MENLAYKKTVHGKSNIKIIKRRKPMSAENLKHKIGGIILILLAIVTILIQGDTPDADGTAAVMFIFFGVVMFFSGKSDIK